MEKKEKKYPPIDEFQINGFKSVTKDRLALDNEVYLESNYNPFEHRNVHKPNTTFGSLLHLIKSSLGSGVLAMPMAFSHGGTVFGLVASFVICYICTYSVQMLIQTSYKICQKTKTPKLDFSETAEKVFQYGPVQLQHLSGFIKQFCDYSMLITYYGILCVYILIISDSIHSFCEFYFNMKWDIRIYICFATLAVILVAQVRELKYLVPFSGVANLLIFATLAIVFYFIFTEDLVFSDKLLVAPWQEWPIFFGTIIFAVEGIGTMLPIANSMKNPHEFLGCQYPNVLNTGMIINSLLFASVGFFGYIRYGLSVESNIVMNLPKEHLLAQIAQIFIAVAIWFTFGLQFYPTAETLFNKLNKRISKEKMNFAQILIRIGICLVLGIIAILIPDIKPIIGLIGSVFLSLLGLLVPCLIETIYIWPNFGPLKWKLIKNIILAAFSIFALISGTIVSVGDIIQLYSRN